MNFEYAKQKDESHGSSGERQKPVTEQLVPGWSSARRMLAQHAPSLEFPSTIQTHHGSLRSQGDQKFKVIVYYTTSKIQAWDIEILSKEKQG